MIPAAINLLCLGFTMSGLATLFSSWDRYRWRSIGIVSGILILQMMAKIGAKSTDSLGFLQWTTFLSAFEPQIQVQVAVDYPAQLWSWRLLDVAGETGGLGPLSSNTILLSIGLLSYLSATWIFCRRDLPAPI
jgi:ABC-2 type transport system permease protein